MGSACDGSRCMGSFLKIAQSINSFFHIANWRHRNDCSHMRTQNPNDQVAPEWRKMSNSSKKSFIHSTRFSSHSYTLQCARHTSSSSSSSHLKTVASSKPSQPASIWIITQNMWMNNWMWTSLSSHYSARRNVMMMMSFANVRWTKAMQLTATQIYSWYRPINIFNRYGRRYKFHRSRAHKRHCPAHVIKFSLIELSILCTHN